MSQNEISKINNSMSTKFGTAVPDGLLNVPFL